MWRFLPFGLKAAVSASLLYFALKGINWPVIAERLNRIDLRWLAFAVVAANLQIFLGAYRWREIAKQCGIRISLAMALRYGYIAAFFNQTLPSTIGGDAARIWLLARSGGWKKAFYSVLLDRVAGVAVLAGVVVASLPWTLELVVDPVGRVALLAIGLGCLCGFVVFLLLRLIRWPWLLRWPPAQHLMAVSVIAGKIAARKAGGTILAQSILIHLLTVAMAWAAAQALAVPFDPLYALLLIPPVVLVATIPISIAGWGVRESAMMTAFAYAGLPETDGLIVSVLYGAAMFLTGAFGGVVWILHRTARPT
jgi:uncharacterized membrane protein YbhN (UPF0104 family)